MVASVSLHHCSEKKQWARNILFGHIVRKYGYLGATYMDGWITISYVQGRGRIMSQPRRPLDDLYFPETVEQVEELLAVWSACLRSDSVDRFPDFEQEGREGRLVYYIY